MSGSPSRKVKRFWEKTFALSEIDYKTLGRRDFSKIIKRLTKDGAKMVMDLGCGFGLVSIALAKAGFEVRAVDISSQAIRRLRVQARKEGLAIETRICAAQDVATDEHFDAVVCNSVLDHMSLEDAQLAIRNIKLLLNERGTAFLSFDGQGGLASRGGMGGTSAGSSSSAGGECGGSSGVPNHEMTTLAEYPLRGGHGVTREAIFLGLKEGEVRSRGALKEGSPWRCEATSWGEEEGMGNFTSLPDGTRSYTKGKRKGMLWRFYSNEEIELLLEGFEIMEFTERADGRREVWVRKITS